MQTELCLIRDVLDNQLVDREQRPIGRVDGIVVELQEDAPPRLAALEVGAPVLARRLHPRFSDWLVKWLKRRNSAASEPYRIPFDKVRSVGIDVEVDLLADETPLMDREKWLREHIIRRIPGSG